MTSIPVDCLHSVEDIGLLLRDAQQDLQALRQHLKAIQLQQAGEQTTAQQDAELGGASESSLVLDTLQQLINRTENSLQAKAQVVLQSVERQTLNTLPPIPSEHAVAIVPYDAEHQLRQTIPAPARQPLRHRPQSADATQFAPTVKPWRRQQHQSQVFQIAGENSLRSVNEQQYGRSHLKASKLTQRQLIDAITTPQSTHGQQYLNQRYDVNINDANDQQRHGVKSPPGARSTQFQQPAQQRTGHNGPLAATHATLWSQRHQYNNGAKSRTFDLETLDFRSAASDLIVRRSHEEEEKHSETIGRTQQKVLLLTDGTVIGSRPQSAKHKPLHEISDQAGSAARRHSEAKAVVPIDEPIASPPQPAAARDYETLLDTYSLHHLMFRFGRVVTSTAEYESFHRKYTVIWPALQVLITRVEALTQRLSLSNVNIDGHQLEALSAFYGHRPVQLSHIHDRHLLRCFLQTDHSLYLPNLASLQYVACDSVSETQCRRLAATKIQSAHHKRHAQRLFRYRRSASAQILRIQRWLRCLLAMRHTRRQIDDSHQQHHVLWTTTVQQPYRDRYHRFVQRYRLYVLVADAQSTSTAASYHHLSNTLLISVLSLLAFDAKASVLYVTPYAISEEVQLHYFSILKHHFSVNNAAARVKFVSLQLADGSRSHSQQLEQYSDTMNNARRLYYNSSAMQQLRQHIVGQSAVLVPASEQSVYYQLAWLLHVPLHTTLPTLPSMTITRLKPQLSLPTINPLCQHSQPTLALVEIDADGGVEVNGVFDVLQTSDSLQLTTPLAADTIVSTSTMQEQSYSQLMQYLTVYGKSLHKSQQHGCVTVLLQPNAEQSDQLQIVQALFAFTPLAAARTLVRGLLPPDQQPSQLHMVYIPLLHHPALSAIPHHTLMSVLRINGHLLKVQTIAGNARAPQPAVEVQTGALLLLPDSLTSNYISLLVVDCSLERATERVQAMLSFMLTWFEKVYQAGSAGAGYSSKATLHATQQWKRVVKLMQSRTTKLTDQQ